MFIRIALRLVSVGISARCPALSGLLDNLAFRVRLLERLRQEGRTMRLSFP